MTATNRDVRAELVSTGRSWAGAQHRLVHLAAALARSDTWATDGSPTPAHWIADALDVELCTAREWIRIGQALEELPRLERAFADGRLSFSKVRVLTRIAEPATEAELCRLAESIPAGRLATALAQWRARHEHPGDTEARQHEERSLTCRTDPDGTISGTFRLPPLAGGRLLAAIDTIVIRCPGDATAVASATHRTLAQQRADALAQLALAGGGAGDTEIVLHVRHDGTTFADGTPVADHAVARLVPLAFIRALVHDADGRPIDATNRRRHPTRRQALVALERHHHRCVDCGTTHFLELDHVPPYSTTHHTVTDELEPRCHRCHTTRHDSEGRR